VEVECYAGRKVEERPLRFRVDGHEYLVREVLDQWYGPEDILFKIRADDGNIYVLRHQTSVPDGEWDLVSFRRSGYGIRVVLLRAFVLPLAQVRITRLLARCGYRSASRSPVAQLG
jgi:hypothetical protein